MTNLQSSAGWPDDFSGRVRLFPLPNLVLFPHVVQPLHMFEPRYCEMLQDALAGDRLLAMVLLEQGWEHPREAARLVLHPEYRGETFRKLTVVPGPGDVVVVAFLDVGQGARVRSARHDSVHLLQAPLHLAGEATGAQVGLARG